MNPLTLLQRQLRFWLADRRRLSRPLKRFRLKRMLITMAIGALWSACLMVILTQTGVVAYVSQWPWVGGITLGLLVSAAIAMIRMALRRLRVRFIVTRLGSFGLATALGLGTVLIMTAGQGASADSHLPVCDATIQGSGLSGPTTASLTSSDDPMKVDLSNLGDSLFVTWNLDDVSDIEGRKWWVKAKVLGRDFEFLSGSGENGVRTYEVTGFERNIFPGQYQVFGEFEGVCLPRTGHLRILGSPVDNNLGRAAIAGLVAATGAALALVFTTRFDLWSFTTTSGVTVAIIDPATGRVAKGPLTRAKTYYVETSVELPDPIAQYQRMPGPIDVVTGVMAAAVAPQLSSFDPRQGQTGTTTQFTVPEVGHELQLNVDLSVGGEVVESIHMIEPFDQSSSTLDLQRGVGEVVYSTGDLGARHLCGIVPVDGTLMVHGDTTGSFIEVWSLIGDGAVVVTGRQRLALADLQEAATSYRRDLEYAIDDWTVSPHEDSRTATLRALARSGAELRRRILGDGTSPAPVDGTLLVAQDKRAVGSITFPWAGLYEGAVRPDGDVTLCTHVDDPDRCTAHSDDVVCPNLLWGYRHELMWPDGWAPGRDEPAGLADRVKQFFTGSRPPRRRLENWMDNRTPLSILAAVSEEFTDVGNLDELVDDRSVSVVTASNLAEFRAALAAAGRSAEIVYFMGHGQSDGPVAFGLDTAIDRQDFCLVLDEPFGGDDLLVMADQTELAAGPIVFLNACRSGVVGIDEQHPILDAFRELGARAVVVTETPVIDWQAAEAAKWILDRFLDGEPMSRALLLARRQELADEQRLSLLTYSYYGPAGLRLATPQRSRPPSAVLEMA